MTMIRSLRLELVRQRPHWASAPDGRARTSSLLVPLHNPAHVTRQVATLTELTEQRFRLGIRRRPARAARPEVRRRKC